MIKKIESILNGHDNFVLYRLPNVKRFSVLVSNPESVIVSNSFSDFKSSCKGFLFAPYNFKKHLSLLLQPDYIEHFELPQSSSNRPSEIFNLSSPDDTYEQAFNACMEQLSTNNKLQKLVLARSKSISTRNRNPIDVFFHACSLYPNAMVYWIKTSVSGSWLGATPELFLNGNCRKLKTVALAGSQSYWIQDPFDLSMWSEKNREEQFLVEEYLRSCIKEKGTYIDSLGPYAFQAGHIAHLKSELNFSINNEILMDFIKCTHPTPAICGLPQSIAKDFLESQEHFDRLYFSGLLGWLEPTKESNLFVNLRCLNWLPNNVATLYAGSGLLPSSSLLSEWMETESKMQTLKQLFE